MDLFKITPFYAGMPPLAFLQLLVPAAPTSYIKQLVRKGKLLLDGRPLSNCTPLTDGALLRLPKSARLNELRAASPPLLLDCLHESSYLLIVDKPSGLAVHRGKGHEQDNLLERLQRRSKARNENFSLAPIHRLDAETSGPVLFGKGHQAISALGKLFMTAEVEKRYWAVVRGDLPEQGRFESPVPAKGGWKDATTRFRICKRFPPFLLLDLELASGRTHQIRRQLADRGLPLVGDRRYRGPALPGVQRLFLHCHRLAFRDPFTGDRIIIDSPLPEALATPLARLE